MLVDQSFGSLAEWRAWADKNAWVYDRRKADELAGRILKSEFIEPLTDARIEPSEIDGSTSNWREGLAARGLVTRARAVLALIELALRDVLWIDAKIFATEAVTGFALRLRGKYPRFLGSEYAAHKAARDALYPIPHQDLMALTLPANTFDLVSTNEVLEHVPSIDVALREIWRVLKPGGCHIGTHPFRFDCPDGDRRAAFVDGKMVYLKLPPEIHGNPADPTGGSLVFETPGWDIIERAKKVGYRDAHMRFVACLEQGFITENTGLHVFIAQK